MPTLYDWLLIGVGYLLGCFSTGYWLVRWKTGRDLRREGSGSTGARNVGRVLGRSGFVITTLGDIAKGAAAVGLARLARVGEPGLVLTLLAVVAGHIWPLPMGFRGGKGINTAAGSLLVYNPCLAVGVTLLALVINGFLRKFVISGLIAILLAPFLLLLLREPFVRLSAQVTPVQDVRVAAGALFVLAAIILIAHRQNIRQTLGRLRHTDQNARQSA